MGFGVQLERADGGEKVNMWKHNLVATEAFLPRMMRLAWSHVVRPEKWLRVIRIHTKWLNHSRLYEKLCLSFCRFVEEKLYKWTIS